MKSFRIKAKMHVQESVIVCRKNALSAIAPDKKYLIFTDTNVLRLYQKTIHRAFPEAAVVAMEAGEEHKNMQTLSALLEGMAKAELHRQDTLICIGGGVVGDIGGLAAALYMRGIGCIQVPTTLLSQVDSSVGGKTAIDFGGVKNLVGVFRQPRQVLVDGAFLKTLPEREIRCGLGEIVKHGAMDPGIFDLLWEHRDRLFDLDFLSSEVVPLNIAFKADVVRRDPDEKGLRKCLNMGHTTAHALELYDGKLSHGEYVLIGMLFEAELARKYADADGAFLDRLGELVRLALGGLPTLPPIEKAAEFARLDKKNATADRVVVTAPIRKGDYCLLEFAYEDYVHELVHIQEELC